MDIHAGLFVLRKAAVFKLIVTIHSVELKSIETLPVPFRHPLDNLAYVQSRRRERRIRSMSVDSLRTGRGAAQGRDTEQQHSKSTSGASIQEPTRAQLGIREEMA